MLNQLLSQLGANTKITVGVVVSPSIGLEMIEVNHKTKMIEKYACKPLEYDYAKREIADYNRFREVLGELFDDLRISRKSNIVLTLPSVYFGSISLPNMLSDDGINGAIISDVEQTSYIFKRQDPVVSWIDNSAISDDKENKNILYAAIQQSALDEINAACIEIGCTLVAIETATNSLLKALSYNQLAEEQMAPHTLWNLMVINPNSYSIITLNGKNIVEYREEPLALRSFVDDEIYDAIISSTQLTLQTVSSNYLYIVSKTDLVSAEVLSMKIPFNGNIKFLESNKYVENPLMQASYNILPNMVLKITPEAIGSGIYNLSDYPIKFNLMGQVTLNDNISSLETPKIKVGNTEVELTTDFVKKFAMLLAAIIVVPSLIILFVLNYLSGMKQSELDSINLDIETAKKELAQYEGIDKKNQFDEKLEINTVQDINRVKYIYYSAIGANMPKDTWLIYLKIYDNKKIDIIGRSTSVENVYKFYKGIKMSVINSDLRLSRLEMSADTIGNLAIEDYNTIKPKFYEFEITNFTDSELKAQEDALNPSSNKNDNQDNNSSNTSAKRRKGFLFEDFLSQPGDSESITSGKAPKVNLPNIGSQGTPDAPPKELPANLESIEKF